MNTVLKGKKASVCLLLHMKLTMVHILQYIYSDIWAAGVILFILLSGSPPFYGRTHKEIFEKIKAGRWGFIGRNWASVSDGAKDLVKGMLVQDPKERLTAEQVLNHPWICEHESVSQANLADTLEDLAKYSARQKFKAAAMVSAYVCEAMIGRLGYVVFV